MNIQKYLILSLIILFSLSCNNNQEIKLEGINFGTAKYFNSFLFVSEKNSPITRKLEIDFNDWASANDSYVSLQLIDKQNNVIGNDNSDIKIYLNNQLCVDGKIELNNNSDRLQEIKLEFLPNSEEKSYSGFLIADINRLDRINNIENIEVGTKIFEWSARYDVVMNPLKKGLLWVLLIIVSLLIIWFVFLRNLIYAKFNSGKLIINSPYSKVIKIKGVQRLVFTTKEQKQPKLNRIFVGRILYEVNPIWDSEVIFTPKNKRNIRIKTGISYSVIPSTNQFTRGRSYEIKSKNELIKISYI